MIYYEQKVGRCGAMASNFQAETQNLTVNLLVVGTLYRRRVNFFMNVQYHRVRFPGLFSTPVEQYLWQ